MIYLNNRIGNTNNLSVQQYSSSPRSLVNKTNLGTDFVTFSAASPNKENQKDKNKTLVYALGAIGIITGIILLVLNFKKGGKNLSGNLSQDVKKGVNKLSEELASGDKNAVEKEVKSAGVKSTDNQNAKTTKAQAREDQPLNQETANLNATDVQKSTPEPINTQIIGKEETAAVNLADSMYAKKLAKEPELKGKEALIIEVLPELKIIQDHDSLKETLKVITPENKDFITKQAVPAFLRNEEALDLGHSIGETLKILTPDTVDCLDKLATNTEVFQIKNFTDTKNLLDAITKENKDFAFDELLPYFADNADKYKITRGAHMAKYLEVITPDNKAFMLNEAIPVVMDNAAKLNIGVSEVAQIAKLVDKDSLKNIKIISDNLSKCDITGKFGMLDIDKLNYYLKKTNQELLDEFNKKQI